MNRVDPFRDHVHELLAPLGDVHLRAMFGGYGIYTGDAMFALILAGTLYLKVDERNVARFVAAGLEPFVYNPARGPTAIRFRRAPDEGLDDGEVLREWSQASIEAARAAKTKRPKRVAKAKRPKRVAKAKPSARRTR